MIIEKAEIIEGDNLQADICIIGGGPAAVSMALELKDTGKKIIVLTGGTWKETAFNQGLHKGFIAEGSSHEPLELYRRRQFGGGTTVWGGRCIPFEPIDFIKRNWIDNSGWPISYDELLPYFKRAAEIMQIGEFRFSLDKNDKELIEGMDDEELSSKVIEKWSLPVNFAVDFKEQLNNSTNLFVYLDAHALKICTDSTPDTISGIEAIVNGKKFKVTASEFILATGALENARVLLSSANENHPAGIGNQKDNVGRYYMAHIAGIYAELQLNNPKKVISWFEKDKDGVYYRRRWRPTDQAQEKHRLANIVFILENTNGEYGNVPTHTSAIIAAKAIRSVLRQKSLSGFRSEFRKVLPEFKTNAANIMLRGWKQVPDIAVKVLKRIPKRRIPIILPAKWSKNWGIFFQSEQTPIRESRVTVLPGQKDPLGMPRLNVAIKIKPDDIESIVKAHTIFVEHYKKSGAGNIMYSEEGLRKQIDFSLNTFSSVAHHIGTTRMSGSENEGVVDSNSKVFGIKNLYIAGASVFPTGSHANPTLTILAQSLRLADYLKKQ